MSRALDLARLGEGLTRPNPPVGAVLVKNGSMVGEGYHRRAGGPHAEIWAMRMAGRRAKGATLFVTLEPCCTTGRTPPCTEAILAAGVRRLVVSAHDPNPVHGGRGLTLLRRQGVDVIDGVLREEGEALIEPFSSWVRRRRPLVTLKLGMSLDGKIADAAGRSRWITGEAARRQVQDLRRRADVIWVGSRTARLDNPSLLPRPPGGRKPFRLVMDAHGRLPRSLAVFTDGHAAQTIIATSVNCPAAAMARWRRLGCDVMTVPVRKGRLSLRHILRELGRRGMLHVVCEGGGELAWSLVEQGLVDRYLLFYAARLLGGRRAFPAIGGKGWPVKRPCRVEIRELCRLGEDVMIRAVPLGG